MNNGFEEIWTNRYSYIWSSIEKELKPGMPKIEDYGLSVPIIKEYLKKEYDLKKKYGIRDDDRFITICLIASTCIIILLDLVLHFDISFIIGLIIAMGLFKLVEIILKKKYEKAHAIIKIDAIELYLHDYEEWKSKQDEINQLDLEKHSHNFDEQKLKQDETKWQVKEERPFTDEEINAVVSNIIESGQYGNSVCFNMVGG